LNHVVEKSAGLWSLCLQRDCQEEQRDEESSHLSFPSKL